MKRLLHITMLLLTAFLVGCYKDEVDVDALRNNPFDSRITGRAHHPVDSTRRQSTKPVAGLEASIPSGAFEELRAFILTLGSDVSPRPPRTNGSFVFKRRRNLVTLIPQKRGLKIDVFRGQDWQNGVSVQPGIGFAAAKKLIAEAYTLVY